MDVFLKEGKCGFDTRMMGSDVLLKKGKWVRFLDDGNGRLLEGRKVGE